MNKSKILSVLKSNSGYVSGEQISQELNISRMAVSKVVSSLRKDGYEIEAITNKGYKLIKSPDVLTYEEIMPYIHSEIIGSDIKCFEIIDSTNNYLKRESLTMQNGTTAIANEQTSGRGRRGNSFQSPKNKGVYFSVLVQPDLPPEKALNFTAFVAVAVCEGIEKATGLKADIKWTNDIVVDNKKVCGILTEMSIESESGLLQHIITGIGINANHNLEDFSEDIRDVAGSLSMAKGEKINRAKLVAEVINSLDEMYKTWLSGGGDYLERYRKRCITTGKEVRLIRADGRTEHAFALQINDDFSLMVRHDDNSIENVMSGEVRVRGLWGYAQ